MKELNEQVNSKYKFICIEPGDIEGVNIGGILALPKEELKTNKLLTMIQFDKCKSNMTDPETGETREVKTGEDAVRRVISSENIDEAIKGLGVERTSLIITSITKRKKTTRNTIRQ